MRITAFSIALFFVALNCSLYLIMETEVLPYHIEPHSNPETMTGEGEVLRVVGSIAILTVGGLITAISGNWLFGAAALTLFALDYLLPFVHWIFFGFPIFINQIAQTSGDPDVLLPLTFVTNALMALVWFWFMLGMFTQRTVEA